jgi:transcriptional regulator with XRE-family HTH domain
LTVGTQSRTLVTMTIYIRLRELRLALGLSQAELAARARTRRATVSRLENSRITAIDLDVLEKLADVLGVEPGFLLSRAPAAAAILQRVNRPAWHRRRTEGRRAEQGRGP